MNRDPSRKSLARATDARLREPIDREPSGVLRLAVERPEECLLFSLGGDPYALPIAVVLEILRPLPITEVPRAPVGIAGLASVRGQLVTVLDPRPRLGLSSRPRDRKTRILLVDAGEEILGLLVEEVRGVQKYDPGQIEPPQVLGGEPPAHVAGVARNAESWCLVLDLRPILEAR